MNWLSAWFNSKNFNTHFIGAAVFGIAGIVALDPQVQAFVKQLCGTHAGLATEIIAACIIVAKYSKSSSPAGTVANSKAILRNTATAPTAAEVDAATTK
jgi:hypothetical protein